MWCTDILNYVQTGTLELLERAKVGESYMSVIPTFLWAAGAAALAHRIISLMFRRFLFRRVPLWEIILQRLLFVWMLIYSLHFWAVVVNVIKYLVEYCYTTEDGLILSSEDVESCKIMQQWVIWMCAAAPIAIYIHTRPKPMSPPLMIWITASPWQRREMGPYGYYLSRPVSSPQPLRSPRTAHTPVSYHHALELRRAYSDSRLTREPIKKKRNSKSV